MGFDYKVSASLFVGFFVSFWRRKAANRDFIGISLPMRCAEVRLSRTLREQRFQLESLILAQNERWRQA